MILDIYKWREADTIPQGCDKWVFKYSKYHLSYFKDALILFVCINSQADEGEWKKDNISWEEISIWMQNIPTTSLGCFTFTTKPNVLLSNTSHPTETSLQHLQQLSFSHFLRGQRADCKCHKLPPASLHAAWLA